MFFDIVSRKITKYLSLWSLRLEPVTFRSTSSSSDYLFPKMITDLTLQHHLSRVMSGRKNNNRGRGGGHGGRGGNGGGRGGYELPVLP